jgi:hypothetical protein
MLRNSLNQRLVISMFEFKKKRTSTYTGANNSCDVLAALQLMTFLLLENVLVSGELSKASDSQMKVLKLSSCPAVKGQLTNHNSFGQVNKKFFHFVIDFLSVQLGG